MAQHYRTIRSYNQNFNEEVEMNIHQCSVVDRVWIDGTVDIDDAPRVAAAIIEMYRFRGYSVDELLETIRKQIQEWDDNGNHS